MRDEIADAVSIRIDGVDLSIRCKLSSDVGRESGQPEGRGGTEAVDEEDWGGVGAARWRAGDQVDPQGGGEWMGDIA